jgi:tetratricopeptide (TPR) repeat protein
MARAWNAYRAAAFVAISIVCWLSSTAIAQQAGRNAAAVAEAYRKKQSARTVDDYSEVVALCQQTLAGEQDAATRKYVQQLLAWAANRRREAYSRQAAKLAEQNKTRESAAADEQALADFSIAVENDPTKWKSFHTRGVSLALVSRYEEALDDLTKAIELKNDYVNSWFNRAEVRYELGQYDDAAADYT